MTVSTQCRVTDGGIETDLIFSRGQELPDFAAFPLLDSDAGRAVLRDYFEEYVAIAVRAGRPMLLETPTWRANPDHAGPLGYDAAALDRVNRHAVDFMAAIGQAHDDELVGWSVGGSLGPRGDGYRSDGAIDPDEAADYHRPQLASLHAAGAERATVLTLTDPGEGVGVARAAADVGIPVGIGFTVETDGRLPDGSSLAEAFSAVEAACPPAYFAINCAHPSHMLADIDSLDPRWHARVGAVLCNASTMSHAELDEAEELDDGDPQLLAADQKPLLELLPNLQVLGGCCGTDARHVAVMWGVA